MAPPGISINIAEKRFGAGAALFADFTLEIAPGSVVALMGPSGIGKSTLLRLVGGIDQDFAGAIGIGGVAAADAPMPGFVFQDPRLLPWLSCLDNVLVADPSMGVEQAEALLDRVGLRGRSRDYPAQLSGGMQRRVALARALASNRDLLLLDEPFVSLDGALAAEMRTLIAELIAEHGSSVLLVTHDPEDAALLADRVIVLGGRPAHIAGDLVFEIERGRQDGESVADYRRLLAASLAGGQV